jgi:RNA polymerase sigma factor (TIGR02999 family)
MRRVALARGRTVRGTGTGHPPAAGATEGEMTMKAMDDRVDAVIRNAPDEGALVDELWSAAYDDLRVLARARLRHSGRRTLLDTTVLVNETYLKLAARRSLPVRHRGAFFAYCGRVMRSVIVDMAREAHAHWHGGELQKVTLGTDFGASLAAADSDPLQVDGALCELARVEPRLAQIVEMRYFGGFTESDIAQSLALTERTVRRDWSRARVLLRSMLAV